MLFFKKQFLPIEYARIASNKIYHACFSFCLVGKETIRRDVEAARILFRQMDEHLSRLETKVSMLS